MQTEIKNAWNRKAFGEKAASIYRELRRKRPLVQCITNAVTVNDCANILLAAGASPTMAHHPLEAAEIAAGCDALVCNFGAVADYEAMKEAALTARSMGHPVVIDPVGVSGSTYRREKCQELLEKAGADALRGNYSEITALIRNHSTVAGVDAMQQQMDVQAMQSYAKEHHLFLVASGETDILTDGERIWYCKNGDPLMARITGSGCMSSAMLGAWLAAENSLESVAACCAFMGLAGEQAAQKTKEQSGGTMTFRMHFIDAISLISPQSKIFSENKLVIP